jgi:hypothetical protein
MPRPLRKRYRQALGIGAEQGAKLWEFAPRWAPRAPPRPNQARDFLAPVYGWFTEDIGVQGGDPPYRVIKAARVSSLDAGGIGGLAAPKQRKAHWSLQ